MYDGPEKEKIDIDQLVNLLIKNRDEKETVETEETPVTTEEAAVVTEFVVPGEVEDEPEDEPAPITQENELVFVDDTEPDPVPAVAADPEPMTEAEPEEEEVVVPMPAKKKRGLFGLFGRKEEDNDGEEEETWNDWGLKPIGHYQAGEAAVEEDDVLLVQPEEEAEEESDPLSVDEFPAVRAVAETITMPVVLPSGMAVNRVDEKTRIIPQVASEQEPAPQEAVVPVAESHDEQLPDQLSLEEMVRVEDMEPVEGMEDIDPDEAPEVRLQRNREEKVREFTLSGEEEEENQNGGRRAESSPKHSAVYCSLDRFAGASRADAHPSGGGKLCSLWQRRLSVDSAVDAGADAGHQLPCRYAWL